MRAISIQLQPERVPGFDLEAAIAIFADLAGDPRLVQRHAFDHGHDKTAYYNFTFGTVQARELWREIQRRLFAHPTLGDGMRLTAIAMCSSETGWDSYLLLSHFDPTMTLDSADELP